MTTWNDKPLRPRRDAVAETGKNTVPKNPSFLSGQFSKAVSVGDDISFGLWQADGSPLYGLDEKLFHAIRSNIVER